MLFYVIYLAKCPLAHYLLNPTFAICKLKIITLTLLSLVLGLMMMHIKPQE